MFSVFLKQKPATSTPATDSPTTTATSADDEDDSSTTHTTTTADNGDQPAVRPRLTPVQQVTRAVGMIALVAVIAYVALYVMMLRQQALGEL